MPLKQTIKDYDFNFFFWVWKFFLSKKFLNSIVLANVKVVPAKFFNFGFYCKPSLFFICPQKNEKNAVEIGSKSLGHPVFVQKSNVS